MNEAKGIKATEYIFKHSELEEWLRYFSIYLKVYPDKNTLIYPAEFATGFAKVYTIEPGLTYRIVDYHLHKDFVFKRRSSKAFSFTIFFYQYTNCDNIVLEIGNEKVVDFHGDQYGAVLMTNSEFTQKLEIKKGTYAQGLTIQLSKKWVISKINPETFSFLKDKKVFQDFLKPKTQKLLSDIFEKNKSYVPQLYMNNRVLRLLEDFFDKVLKNEAKEAFPFSSKEVTNLLKVKSMLLETYNSGFPSIDVLAKLAFMSTTKLKKVFKQAFGMGMYEFYQKNRMHKAKEILDSGVYSISEAGYMVGYKNMSNFASAFKKEFGKLPKDFIKAN